MARVYPVKKKNSLKENMKEILPLMYDDLIIYKETVLTHPLAKNVLHRMRITGKPFRYAMEIGEVVFGAEFVKYLDEVKNTVELMGEIHDADVMIPDLKNHLREVRMINNMIRNRRERISTKCLRDIIHELRYKRITMYEELCRKLNGWDAENFREKIIAAMNNTQMEIIKKNPAA